MHEAYQFSIRHDVYAARCDLRTVYISPFPLPPSSDRYLSSYCERPGKVGRRCWLTCPHRPAVMPFFFLSRVTCPTIVALVFLRLCRLRDVLFTYEHFDSRDLVQYTDAVGVTDLTCRTPGGEVLFRNLTFRVQQGESLLIMGPSGSGA